MKMGERFSSGSVSKRESVTIVIHAQSLGHSQALNPEEIATEPHPCWKKGIPLSLGISSHPVSPKGK